MTEAAGTNDARAHNLPTVTVILPAVLMDLFPGSERRLEIAAATVADLLDALDERWPGMRDRVRDSTPAIRRHINVFVDGERARLDTPLSHVRSMATLKRIAAFTPFVPAEAGTQSRREILGSRFRGNERGYGRDIDNVRTACPFGPWP